MEHFSSTHTRSDGLSGNDRRNAGATDSTPDGPPLDGAFALGAGLNAAYVAAEAAAGLVWHSVALLADAGHNLGDVLGLACAFLAARLSRARPSRRFTYGLGGSSILAALVNAMVLLVVTAAIAVSSIDRLLVPTRPAALAMTIVAAVGIAVNGGTALLFLRGRADLNVRAAFVHMAADAAIAAGVVVSGLLIALTGADWIDPLAGLAIAVAISISTFSLLRDSLAFALGAVPPGIDLAAVETSLRALPGVTDVHALHVWGLSTTETALTAHLVRPGADLDDALLAEARVRLRAEHGIGHATLQIERGVGLACAPARPGAP